MDDIQKYAAEQRTEPEQMTNGEAKPKAINSTQRTKSRPDGPNRKHG
ncbi:hypothetical protein LJK88_41120 [Paenibacillus sp. P26]|nr:hypothetical protein LJK88_41120 [Paenibacillus sp. P26]